MCILFVHSNIIQIVLFAYYFLLRAHTDGRVPCGVNPNIRLYRYEKKQRFGQHVDGSVGHLLKEGPHKGVTTVSDFTLLMYLNENIDGGETIFYGPSGDCCVNYKPKRGYALLHGHGDRCLTHEGGEVKKGTKYLLRSDVMYKDP